MRTPRRHPLTEARRPAGPAAVRRAVAASAVLALLGLPGLLDRPLPFPAQAVFRTGSAAATANVPVTALLELDTPSSWQAWRSAEEDARRARRSPAATRRAAAGAGERQRRTVTAAADRTEQALRSA
uniref:hypothetical protein n=1 Tax=Peterkaempfera griseoplana TaxID=66896 RepID=UPI000A6BBEF9